MYNGDLTPQIAGSIGGQMVKKMIQQYEEQERIKQIKNRTIDWDTMAQKLIDMDIDTTIDLEYSLFICPECQEPIYKEDYNEFVNGCCPVCGIVLIK